MSRRTMDGVEGISTAWIVARGEDDEDSEDDTDREPATGVTT